MKKRFFRASLLYKFVTVPFSFLLLSFFCFFFAKKHLMQKYIFASNAFWQRTKQKSLSKIYEQKCIFARKSKGTLKTQLSAKP
jgi:hypothetical protein